MAGTENRRCFETPPGTADRSEVTVRIAARDWLSHLLVDSVLEIILKEHLRYSTVQLEVLDPPGLVYEDLTAGRYDVDMEQWNIFEGSANYVKYVETDESVLIPNPLVGIGYTGRTGLFVTPGAVVKSEFTDFYLFYEASNRAAVKAYNFVMFGEDGLHDFLASEGLEPYCVPHYDSCGPGATEGFWIPPLCRERPTECTVMFSQTPAFDAGYFEQLTYNNNLSMIHAWGGTNTNNHVKSLMAAGKEVVFYSWEPDPFPQSVDAVRVSFPDHNYGCDAGYVLGEPYGPTRCDRPEALLIKAAAAALPQKAPEAYAVIRDMTLYLDQIKAMISRTKDAGGTLTPYDAACEWVKANADVVETWAPPCIVAPKAEPENGDLVFDPALLACREVIKLPERNFTYECDYGASEPVSTAQRQDTAVKVVWRSWHTQEFVASVAQLLLKDFLGYTVFEVDGTDRDTQLTGEDLEKGAYDLEPESWRANRSSPLYVTYVEERGTVLNPGTIGYSGRSGTYILSSTDRKSRWAKWWRFYSNWTNIHSEGLNFLRYGYQDPDVPTLKQWTSSHGVGCTASWCSAPPFEGFWVPPKCLVSPTMCILYLQAVSSYDAGYFEALTRTLGSPFIHAYYGFGMEDFVKAIKANGTYDLLIYGFEPDPFIAGLGVVRLSYPDHSFGCDVGNDRTPDGVIGCDYPELLLQKLASTDSRLRAPESYYMFKHLEVFKDDIDAMVKQHTSSGGTLTSAHDVGCWWIRENLERVQSGIVPDCISKPVTITSARLGDFYFDGESLECLEVGCQPDEVLDTSSGTVVCRRCGEGQLPDHSDGGSSQCVPCAAGSSPNRTSGECDPCPRGSYCTFGVEEPEACSYGSFSSQPGLTECLRCAPGTYQPLAGRSECDSCREPMTTAGEGSRNILNCVCPLGYYKPLNVTDELGYPYDDDIEVCETCPEGLDCQEGSDMVNVPCIDGQLLEDPATATAGTTTVASLSASSRKYPVPQPRFFTQCSEPLSVFFCISEPACPGGQVELCKEGFEGIACGRCTDGLYLSGVDCILCKDIEKSRFLFPTLPILAAPMGVVFLYYISRDPVSQWNSPANHLASGLFVVLVYVQTLAAISSCYMRPSSVMRDSTEWTSYAFDLLSLLRPSCATFSDFTVGFVGSLFLPVYAAVAFVLVYSASVALGRAHPQLRMDGDMLSNCFWSLFNTFFIGISRQTFQLFQCYAHPNGEKSLRSQSDVLCYSALWNDIFLVSAVAVVVFCGGFITLNIWIIWVAPTRFHERGFQKRWKFVFIKFRPNVWWWGLVLLCKGVWVNLPTVVFDYGSAQVFWLEWALISYLMSCVTLFPWRGFLVGALDIAMHAFLVGLFGFLPHFVDPYPDDNERDQIGKAYTVFSMSPLLLGSCTLTVLLLKRLSILPVISQEQWQESAYEVFTTFGRLKDLNKLGETMAKLPWFDVMMLQHAARLVQTEVYFDTRPRPVLDTPTAAMLSGTRLKATESEEESKKLHQSSASFLSFRSSSVRSATMSLDTGEMAQLVQQEEEPANTKVEALASVTESQEEKLQVVRVDQGTSPRVDNVGSEGLDDFMTPRTASAEVKRLRREVANFEKLHSAVTSLVKQMSPRGLPEEQQASNSFDVPREVAPMQVVSSPRRPVSVWKRRFRPISPRSPWESLSPVGSRNSRTPPRASRSAAE